MEFLLLFAVVGIGIWAYTGIQKANERAMRAIFDLSDLKLELQETRKALLKRIEELEERPAVAPEAAPEPESRSEPGPIPFFEEEEEKPAEPEVAAQEPVVEAPVVETPVAAEPPAPRPPVEPPPPPEPEPLIDWEQWVGVRGAAVLGGVVLALAAVMFLRYAIDHGLIPPIVRVAIGFLVGVGAIFASEKLRDHEYVRTANPLAGAGIVALYAACWAARVLYELIPAAAGFAVMILITVACGALAWRHRAREIAVLGLFGGFATPLLLSTGSDNPIGLFGYVLMLDVGLLWLARARGWPALGAMAMAGTFFYQALWVVFRMDADRTFLGLAILAVFALVFLVSFRFRPTGDEAEASPLWKFTQVSGVVAPFVLALYFAGNADLGVHLYPLAALMLLLSIAVSWLARADGIPDLALAAAGATLAIVFTWCARTDFTNALSWEMVAISIVLALAYHVLPELDLRRGVEREERDSRPALAAAAGFFALTILFSLSPGETILWPWLTAWAAFAALLVRQASLPGGGWGQIVAALGLGVAFPLYYLERLSQDSPLAPGTLLALPIFAAAIFLGLSLRSSRREASIASLVLPLTALVVSLPESFDPVLPAWLYLATTIGLALLAIFSATRMSSGPAYLATVLLLAFSHLNWTSAHPALGDESSALTALVLQLLTVAALSYLPFWSGERLASNRWALYGAALAAPLWFLPLKELYETCFGTAAIGLLPVALAALSLGAVMQARQIGVPDDPARKRSLVWFSAVALAFVSVAIPLQLDKEWITLGWAILGFAITELWKRLDHPGLKYFALALLAAVTARLVLNPEIFTYHARSGVPVFNWLMYTYLIPVAALIGSARNLNALEVSRAVDKEGWLYARERPIGAILCGAAAIAVMFVWINLTVFDAFSTGRELDFSFDRRPARDLTLSLAWAVYALGLLASGFRINSEGLRWVSLAFLLLTIGKVFLYDLGELEDLYRVASLVGLALSLIAVSLAYQRFVFSKRESEGET